MLGMAILLIIGNLVFNTNTHDWNWRNNSGSYLNILAMIFICIAMVLAAKNKKLEK